MRPYYSESGIEIYCGDCREVLPHVSADVLVTDPPYGVEFNGKVTRHTRNLEGYTVADCGEVGPQVVSLILPTVKRAAVFPGNRGMFLYPQPQDIGCVYCPSGAGIGPWGFTCFHPILFYGTRPNTLQPTSIQSFATVGNLGHPCPKPLPWLRWLLTLATLPGETVLDPFAGSGTTLRAAKDLGLRAIGIEIEEKYCRIAVQRLRQEVFAFATAD